MKTTTILPTGVKVQWNAGKMAVTMPSKENRTDNFKKLMELWEQI